MEVPQYLLLDLFSRSRAQGVVVLAEQWRTTQQYIAAWRASINGPTTRDSMFPGFTKQMVICLKAEATDNMSQVFNLIEHVGLANELSKALSTISNTHGDNYQTYVAWRRQQERRGGSLDSYGSFRKFIIHQAVTTLFGHEPESTAVNLKLVNSLVRRAEVLRALELAFGPGVFVLLLGFTGSSEKAWNEGTEAILKTLPNSCPMRRRVCNLANKNIWSKVHIRPESLPSDADVSAGYLRSTMSAFIQSGATVEAQTIRWLHIARDLWEIGVAQKDKNHDVDGQIAQSTLNMLYSVSVAPPYRRKEMSPERSAIMANELHADQNVQDNQNEAEEHLDSGYDEHTSKVSRQGVRLHASGKSPQMPAAQAKKSIKKRAVTLVSQKEVRNWHSIWSLVMRPHNSTKWAAGLTGVVTRTFSHDSVNNLVQFLEDLYRTKDIIAINDGSREVEDLRKENDQAQEVALKYKALWSISESAALSQHNELFAYHKLGMALCKLEAELDQIDHVPTDQLSDFARKYLGRRGQSTRLRDTENSRARFVPQHLLEVLGYGKESGHSDAEVKEKKRMLKSQRMTANNVKAFVDCFDEGCLLLMSKSPWLSALPQVSDTTVKPLLEKLAAEEPELREIAQMAGASVKYVKDRNHIANMPKIVIRAQEMKVEQRGRFSMLELLSPPKPQEQAELTPDESSDDEREMHCNPQ
ncbi:hypothetical protein KCU81_g7817, partial [Aureobasidium melanogenum]